MVFRSNEVKVSDFGIRIYLTFIGYYIFLWPSYFYIYNDANIVAAY